MQLSEIIEKLVTNNDYDTFMMYFLIISFGILMFCPLIAFVLEKSKVRKLERYWDVEIGMSEEEMLEIMGGGYSRSLLKNNRIKYEWRINARSYNSSYRGIYFREYTGVKKVSIYLKNGFVEEIIPYNV